MSKIYKSDVSVSIHELMEGLYEGKAIDRVTMREFDESCLVPTEEFPPDEIRALREREMMSQPVLARYLNVSKNLISDWERGVKKPGGPALRLLSIIKHNGLSAISRLSS